MNEERLVFTWRAMLLAFLLPLVLLWAMDLTMGGSLGAGTDSLPRFGNAILTSYTLGSLVLLGNLFFYADSRQRPLAPLFGMLSAAVMGVVVTVLLLNQGSLLMEDNGSIQAQIFYNIVHMFVSAGAILLALALSLGFTFSTITAQKPRRTVFEEE
ncbi:MAG: hypothetical protein P8Q98_05085 [Candidatus Poseidoniaceae archaeon]|nr:hypothetical protein [Candidatus Poseidoniaceae archaeon]